MFFQNSLAFSMIQWILAIWSPVLLPFLNPTCTSASSWFTYCWSQSWRSLSITLLACEMSAIVWQFVLSLALPFFGIQMKIDLFQSYVHCWVVQICWHIECRDPITWFSNISPSVCLVFHYHNHVFRKALFFLILEM